MSDQKERSEDQKQLDELSATVGNLVASERIQRAIQLVLGDLLSSLGIEIRRGTLEALLLYRGRVAQKHDQEWARVMAAIWVPEGMEDMVLPTSPYEMQAMILGWQKKRERDLGVAKYRAGLGDGFKEGAQQGVRLGFGASEMGKTLDEALMAAEKIKPTE